MPGGYGELLVSSLVVLVLVCVVAWLVVRYGGRFIAGARGRSRGMDVVARLPLEPRRSLYVVEVAGKTLLVGTSEMGLSVLSELDGERVRADVARGGGGGFAAAIRAVLGRKPGRDAAAPPAPSEGGGNGDGPKGAA